jgi:hypothetical protein
VTRSAAPAWRPVALASLAARNVGRAARDRVVPPRAGVRDGALDEAVAWLARTHDATGRRGSSKGFSLVHGWLPAYPETTGYVLEVLLWHAGRRGRPDLAERARAMGDWEIEVQEPDGGVMEGHVGTTPRRSVVFNTGQVLHGWMTLIDAGDTRYEEPARRAARFLADRLRGDGTWDPAVQYGGIPHTYDARVAWAMLRWARHSGEDDVEAAARRQLDWVVAQQRPNGAFEHCVFRPGMAPSTHGLAYTMRGLVESHALVDEERWLRAAVRTAEALARKLEVHDVLPGHYETTWEVADRSSCLTGTVQLGGVWLRLETLTGDPRWLNAGLKAVEQAAAFQETARFPPIRGALAGSFPLWGRYAPLQYPNWATRFLAESLMLYEDALPA